MITKGHDFQNVTLVAAVNPDRMLYASDFRAPEHLFALLMQAAGRAGRSADTAHASEMWIQTSSPHHQMFTALLRHDYPAFALHQLVERAEAGLPPYTRLALLRADARGEQGQEIAQAFLGAIKEWAIACASGALQADPNSGSLPAPAFWQQITWYAPVPLTIQRVANVERAQLLLESHSRPALQAILAVCGEQMRRLHTTPAHRAIVRWAIDVDPLSV
jgi:primosomal protein N' (replication factor Y)